ncbi:MAG: four helix bundle protein [Bacteroidales bacterium]|nr:four helix bundle protein [Bacteroidales bacterium]
MRNFNELIVYQKAFKLAMEVYQITKSFPREEMYSLASQFRRSTRGVCSNIAEGYRKRLYPAHFLSKTSDADMENSETIVWIDISLACSYISQETAEKLNNEVDEIGKLLGYMIQHPEIYCQLPTANCKLSSCQLPTANCKLQTFFLPTANCKLQTFFLPTAYFFFLLVAASFFALRRFPQEITS